MNSITVCGRLGADPVLRQLGESQVADFRFAESVWNGKESETIWYRVCVWGKRAESIAAHLKKGDKATVIGELRQRSFTDRNGVERTSLEIRAGAVDFGGQGGSKEDELPF